MKMEVGMANVANSVGFVFLTGKFEGQTTKISLFYLKRVMELLNILEDMDFPAVEIGVKNGAPLLFFLDKEQKMALAITPRVGRE